MTAQDPLPPIPPETLRLFAGYAPDVLREPSSRSFVIGRLLEEGESSDLRWMSEAVGREEVRRWLAQRSARQLSRRSRAFWELLLEVEAPDHTDPRLWLL